MRLTLAVATYERPEALTAALATVGAQSSPPDEIVVADDGSSDTTRIEVERFAARASCPVHYVRQEHTGYRLARLRNLAIARARGDYIVFVDGDMLLDPRFMADHRRLARARFWTQGVRLPLTRAATARAIANRGELSASTPAGVPGMRRLYALHSAYAAGAFRGMANAFVAVKGCHQAFWREDLITVNGFNEEMVGWGPEDKELCARLAHLGVARQTLFLGGIAYHLHHAPASREHRAANEAVLARTRAQQLTRCAHGLDAHL